MYYIQLLSEMNNITLKVTESG